MALPLNQDRRTMQLFDFVGESDVTLHQVRPADLDRLGHVNNARVLEFLELGRLHWAEQRYEVAEGPHAPVVSKVEVNYIAELFLGQLQITTKLEQCRTFSVTFTQEIAHQGSFPAVKAASEVCFLDLGRRRPVRVRVYSDACLRHRGSLASNDGFVGHELVARSR